MSSEFNYYSIVEQSDVRKLIKEKKIEVCRILSEKISDEILQEAKLCHTMTYISLDFLNQASEGIVTVWNAQRYFEDIRNELHTKLYLNSNQKLFYIPLYTLDYSTEIIEQKYNVDSDEMYYNKYIISLKKNDKDPDGFLFFWNDTKETDEFIGSAPIHEYVYNQIQETIQKINACMKEDFSQEDVGEDGFLKTIVAEEMLQQDVTKETTDETTKLKSVDEAAAKKRQDDFTNLVNKYNSYKEVRI